MIAIAYADSGKNVVHDRWLLTNGAGLRLGASFNSLGAGKLSEVSELEPARAGTIEKQLDLYIDRQRTVDGARLQYSTFTLD